MCGCVVRLEKVARRTTLTCRSQSISKTQQRAVHVKPLFALVRKHEANVHSTASPLVCIVAVSPHLRRAA